MQVISQLVNLLKNLAGTRGLIFLFFSLLIGGILFYQYIQKQDARGSKRGAATESEIPAVSSRFKDMLIAGIALVLIISFLIVTFLLIYLLFAG